MRGDLHAFFLDAGPGRAGQRFCLHHRPTGPLTRGSVVYVHPFAEEMNRSRRMAALQSRALTAAGFAVLQIDLLGCGDSSGEFADATWQDWVADVLLAARWLRQRHDAPLWLWGLRAGCLLASAAQQQIDSSAGLLFWQPGASGSTVLQQFLRLKLAGDMLGGSGKSALAGLKQRLSAGHAVDIAGYTLSPALANGLQAAALALPAPPAPVVWLEVSSSDAPALLPASESLLSAWRPAGAVVSAQAVHGPAFWQTTEIETAPALLAATLAALCEEVPA